ncbi:MAG: cysteine--tRNA ligase [archaeon]
MSLKIYNTESRKKEIFKPIEPGLLKIYVCGVTVYDQVHLGHAFSGIYYDMIINYFKHFHNYDVLYIRNITDVGHLVNDADNGEDKIEKRAKERKIHPMELVEKYCHLMWEDFDKLLMDRPNIEPRATGHIIEMQDWIKKIIDNGYAYEVNGNVYYNISKFKDYGKFANRDLEKLEENTRFENDSNKKNIQDFALWIKATPEHIMQWNSPWGNGYPGWHIECSVMSTKYLGDSFDIHGGGIEHLFPHHQNEIAQYYAYYKKKVVNYWVHNAMLSVEGRKMGKSLGNFITIKDFLKTHEPRALRHLITSAHYRKPQNYTETAINDSENVIKKLDLFTKRLSAITSNNNYNLVKPILELTINNFKNSMDDDFNSSAAWASIFYLIKEVNKLIDEAKLSKAESREILNFLNKINLVFKVFSFENKKENNLKHTIPEEEILKEIEKRNILRKNKKWQEADLIRVKLQKKGVILSDNTTETSWYYE